jgi:ribonuclease HII
MMTSMSTNKKIPMNGTKQPCVYPESTYLEIALDEAGRGPLFGRIYVAAVVLPSIQSHFQFDRMCDSKKIKSKKKMKELAEYIQEHAIAYSIQYLEADMIDKMNILQATMMAMHHAITDILQKLSKLQKQFHIIVDGNYFTPYHTYSIHDDMIMTIPHTTIEKGDNQYSHLAASSILAKHARDEYILSLCDMYPELKQKYHLHTNMGYGTKQHMEGIQQYGITEWHRQSFSPCQHKRITTICQRDDEWYHTSSSFSLEVEICSKEEEKCNPDTSNEEEPMSEVVS